VGEASHSQLRVWEHSLPSIVTRVGWYAGLPEDAVAWVRPGHEVHDLQEHWVAFLRDSGSFRRKGEFGRRYLEHHHRPQSYAHNLLQFAAAARDGRAGWVERSVAAGCGRAADGWLPPELRPQLEAAAAEVFAAMMRGTDAAPADDEPAAACVLPWRPGPAAHARPAPSAAA
jgi:hypothetical protein